MSTLDPTVMSADAFDPREVALEGSTNFRDLGGLVNRHGQAIRNGRIFRSDALARLTATDLERLSTYRITTLIDLRSVQEQERTGPSQLIAHHGTRVVHAPVTDLDASPTGMAEQTLVEMYQDFLVKGTAAYSRVFTTLSTDEELPAVIHCAAGKDRTGVAVALLLRLLDVPDETIVEDYAITDRNMQRMIRGWMESNPELASKTEGVRIPEHVVRAHPETMEAFLVALDETYGSAEDYLLTTGVTSTGIDRLRVQLLG